jgi:hypothetical protein
MSARKRAAVSLTALCLAGTALVGSFAAANPSPPTNGGNGAGQSGQCTGAASERPAACQSK